MMDTELKGNACFMNMWVFAQFRFILCDVLLLMKEPKTTGSRTKAELYATSKYAKQKVKYDAEVCI